MPTTTFDDTYQRVLDKADLTDLADALRQMGFGKMNTVIKATFASLADTDAHDITTAASKAAATIVGVDLDTGENLPPVANVVSCRITAGTAGTGPSIIQDAGATPAAIGTKAAGTATLSDDGKTFTFDANVTGFVLVYIPRSLKVMTSRFALNT